jgi:hypothetical protein
MPSQSDVASMLTCILLGVLDVIKDNPLGWSGEVVPGGPLGPNYLLKVNEDARAVRHPLNIFFTAT